MRPTHRILGIEEDPGDFILGGDIVCGLIQVGSCLANGSIDVRGQLVEHGGQGPVLGGVHVLAGVEEDELQGSWVLEVQGSLGAVQLLIPVVVGGIQGLHRGCQGCVYVRMGLEGSASRMLGLAVKVCRCAHACTCVHVCMPVNSFTAAPGCRLPWNGSQRSQAEPWLLQSSVRIMHASHMVLLGSKKHAQQQETHRTGKGLVYKDRKGGVGVSGVG